MMTDPAYLRLYESGELKNRVEAALAMLHDCRLCGWNCGIDREADQGPCRTGLSARVSTAYVHLGEERPLVGVAGSGAIFFANCDLRCQFCQTARWNIEGDGQDITSRQLADLMLNLQSKRAVNINLITPTHVAPQILDALLIAVEEGLRLPLVWNSGGYDSPELLNLLDGIVDIYLPDMKFADADLAKRMSGISGYPAVNRAAVAEMQRQVGDLVIDDDGIARRGLIIRHLVMPGLLKDTKVILGWIRENIGARVYLSLMDQYRPAHRAFDQEGIDREITAVEYKRARRVASKLGLNRLDGSLQHDYE